MNTNFVYRLSKLLKKRKSIELMGLISMISLELIKRSIAEEVEQENKCPHSLGDECDCPDKLK